ncbi:MAG: bifunctional 4-hydroxy-2-oxoglutarate aldolase/2-dehydro-3-deoxy-phosphogluconate aldolase [Kordiimonas sp.]
MKHKNLDFASLLSETKIIPVLVINDIENAVPTAEKLVSAGYKTLEVTLRTDCALEAIRAMRREVPEACVGVGTVTEPAQLVQSYEAGAAFAVSPGATDALYKIANKVPLPLLPGVSTASEAMAAQERGYRYLKLFPAEAVGGIKLLKSLGGPLPDLRFCPTGGITEKTAGDYLALKNVICVGGSWMT